MNNVKILAYYLPQYHRTKENDEWWGNGFTEWTNVAAARPLFKDHYQPKIPTDLGFYDLRFTENREAQAKLAAEAGISAFCYWHYWFGNGKKTLEMPLEEILRLQKPDFPFCIAWANHSWYKKSWKTNYGHFVMPQKPTLLIEQTYPGIDDIDAHFYYLLNAFKDRRYFKINDRLVFTIYAPQSMPNWELFKKRWQELADKEGLPGFYFIAHTFRLDLVNKIKAMEFDAINLSTHHEAFPQKEKFDSFFSKFISVIQRSVALKPQVVEYAKAIELMKSSLFKEERIFPTIIPNWDHTPRSGYFGTCFHNSTPQLFAQHIEYLLDTIKEKDTVNQVLFLKSWNEWGEGNYMEPDIKYGDEYIKTLKRCLNK